MTRKRFNVVTIAAMIAILALGALGLGYADWTDQLNVNGTVATGTFDVEWQNDNGAEVNDPAGVGTCVTAISGDKNTLTVTLATTYPGYSCTISADAVNVGSIPAEITGATSNADPELTFSPIVCVPASPTIIAANGGSVSCSTTVTVGASALEGQTYNMSASVTFGVPS